MLVLAMDTATAMIGAAVADASGVLGRAVVTAAAKHGELLAPMVSRALAAAGVEPSALDAIGVGIGPGPFTGLRVGVVHAKVMGLALGIPVYGVCTLDVVAREVAREAPAGPFLVATDARRREVYWAAYDRRGNRTCPPQVGSAAAVPRAAELPAAGAGAALYPDSFTHPRGPLGPDPAELAGMVVELALTGREADPVEPLYLRRPDAVANPTRKPVMPR